MIWPGYPSHYLGLGWHSIPNLYHIQRLIVVKFDIPKTFGYRADINDLKKYTQMLLESPELCKKMGDAGRQHVKEKLDYRVTSKYMLDLIKEKLNLE